MIKSNTGFFSDLDQTLVYSSKNIETTLSRSSFNGLVVVETNNGHPSSYMSLNSVLNLHKISKIAHFIPTTTRTVEQYNRINFPLAEVEYAITTNGAVILKNGVEDEDWTTHIKEQLENKVEILGKVYDFWAKRTEDALWVKKLNKAQDIFCYFIVDRNEMPYHFLEELDQKAEEWNYKVSVQGRKVYFIPKFLTKAYAVQEVSKRLKLDTVIAAGDSNLDRTMLSIADLGYRPSHGGLHEESFNALNLTVTEAYGVQAGEEITKNILDYLLT